jgi:hypothetical protein
LTNYYPWLGKSAFPESNQILNTSLITIVEHGPSVTNHLISVASKHQQSNKQSEWNWFVQYYFTSDSKSFKVSFVDKLPMTGKICFLPSSQVWNTSLVTVYRRTTDQSIYGEVPKSVHAYYMRLRASHPMEVRSNYGILDIFTAK